MQKNLCIYSFCKRKTIIKIQMTLKLITLLIYSGTLAASAISYSQSTKLDIEFDNASLTSYIEDIEKKSEFIFIYDAASIDLNSRKTLSTKSEDIAFLLDEIFKGTDIAYKIDDRQVFLYKKDKVVIPDQYKFDLDKMRLEVDQQKQIKVSGKVTDKDNTPIPGVTVMVKGTSVGINTDGEGRFSLSIPSTATTLVFSFVGLQSQEIEIGNNTVFNVVMSETAVGLDEVVVVGYGTQKRETVSGAINQVSTAVLLKSPQANISNMMTGRIPGIMTKQVSGTPGMDQSKIRIRGSGTFTGSADPLILVDGVESSSFNNLDPNEIENISVLKDASATAVYGVRGANGVILVTTKRGSIGKPVISFSSNVGIVKFTDLREGLDAYNWSLTYNEALKYDSYISGSYVQKVSDVAIEHYRLNDDPIFFPNSNWREIMMNDYTTQNQQNFNISGGGKVVKYFVSVGHYSQSGLFADTETLTDFDAQLRYNRYNIRSNFDVDFTKRLSANIKLASQVVDRRGAQRLLDMDTSSQTGVGLFMVAMYLCNPMCSPGIIDGKLINSQDFYMSSPYANYLDRGLGAQYFNDLTGQVRLNYKLDFITEGLTVHATASYNNYLYMYKDWQKNLVAYKPVRLNDNSISYYPLSVEGTYGYNESMSYNKNIYIEAGLDYRRTFGNHNITGLVLYNQTKQYPGPSLAIPRGWQGLVGRITYDYNRRYMAEFNLGYNGTENFAKGRRFGLFPAFSVGWLASEEGFFPKNNIITLLKLRGSYGEVGNDQIGGARFLYRPTSFTLTGGYYFGEIGSSYQLYQGVLEGTLGNELLTWEKAKKTDIGVDLAFFKDRLKITADWFLERRNNILSNLGTVPTIVGATLPAYNLGKMKNTGYDGDVTWQSSLGKFGYFLTVNYTYAHNKILFMDEVKKQWAYQYQTGQRVGQNFGLLDNGLYNTWEEVNDAMRPKSTWSNNKLQPGDINFRDVNGDGIISTLDQVPVGYGDYPEKFYGITIGGNYGGLDFSVLFQGAMNVSYYASQYSYKGFMQDGICVTYLPEWSWTQEKFENGDKISLPRLQISSGHNDQTSSFYLENANYLRLKNFEVGYSLTNINLLDKLNMSSARIYINGNNLITWKHTFPGEDPEETRPGANEVYPPTQVWNIGINVKF